MSCLSSSSSIGSQAREGVARVRFENPPCYGEQSRRCAEVSLLYTGQSRRRAEGVSGTRRVQRLVNRPALSVTPAFLLQDGRQDARGGQNARCRQPAKCMRWTRRKVPVAGKMHEAGSQQNAWGGQDARCGQPAKCMRWTRRKVWAAGKMHEVDKTQGAGKTQGSGKTQGVGKTQGAGSQQNAWGGKSAKQREHKTENNRCGKMLGPQSAARERFCQD